MSRYQVAEDNLTEYDCAPNELLDETRACSICEHGHTDVVCAWCVRAGVA